MIENLRVKGTVYVYEGKKEKLIKTIENMFMDAGKQGLLNFLMGDYSIGGYKYLAIGDTYVETVPTMTQLQNELFRKEISDIYIEDNNVVVDCYIENIEANFVDIDGKSKDWAELGLIVGGEAKSVNSGLLYNRVSGANLISKNSGKSITISWVMQINS